MFIEIRHFRCTLHEPTHPNRGFPRYELFKAYCLRDAQTGLTFNSFTLCPHCIYVFCIYLKKKQRLVPLTSQTDWFL